MLSKQDGALEIFHSSLFMAFKSQGKVPVHAMKAYVVLPKISENLLVIT